MWSTGKEIVTRKTTSEKNCPGVTFSTSNPNGLTWDSTQAFVVKSQWLSSWAIAGLCFYLQSGETEKYQCDSAIVSCLLPHVGKAMHISCPPVYKLLLRWKLCTQTAHKNN